jgi:hypothetical protein
MSVLLMGGIYDICREMASGGMIYLPSFMMIDTGVQAILRFRLIKLRGCNIGITDGRDLGISPLRWARALIYVPRFIKICSHIQTYTPTHTQIAR